MTDSRLPSPRRRSRAIVATTLLLVVGVSTLAVAAPQQADGARVAGPQRAPTETLRDYDAAPAPRVELAPLTDEAPGTAPETGPLRVGAVRWLTTPQRLRTRPARLEWQRHTGGRVAALSVSSPGARSVRLGLRVRDWPEDAEVRAFGHGVDRRVHGPLDAAPRRPAGGLEEPFGDGSAPGDAESLLWTPLVDGDTASLELYLPTELSPAALDLEVVAVAHVTVSPFGAGLRDLADIGSAGACNQDVRCTDIGALRDSVAKILFVSGRSVFLCTGQLLVADGGSDDLLSTANHCISEADEARSLDMFWFFERAVCEGPDPASVFQTGGGRLLHTADVETATDFTLIRLDAPPPGGAYRSGWSAWEVPDDKDALTIHHPGGDLKMVSQGTVTDREPWEEQEFDSHLRVFWSTGVTEGGSSGGGLWVDDRFVGVLTGGASSCSSPRAPDLYGRLDLTFPDLRGWLQPRALQRLAPGSAIADDVDGDGWVHYRVAGGSGNVRVRLQPGSGDPDLYVAAAAAPGLDSFDCRSAQDTGPEACDLSVGAEDAFVGVYGGTAAEFDLTIRAGGGGGGAGLPGVPDLQRPRGRIDRRDPTYEWRPAAGADSYEVRIERRGEEVFRRVLDDAEACADGTCALASPPAPSLEDGVHRWTVRGANAAGLGEFARPLRLAVRNAPSPLAAPAPASPAGDGDPQLLWSPVEGATAYELQVRSVTDTVHGAEHPAGPTCDSDECGLDASAVGATSPGLYRWRVRAVDGERLGPWSGEAAFRIPVPDRRVGNAPRPLRPRGRTVMPVAFYEWIAAENAEAYRVQIVSGGDTVLDHELPADLCDGGLCTWDPPGTLDIPEGGQRWRVRARIDGTWSAERGNGYRLIVGAPRLITPVGPGPDGSPAFQWSPVPGAVRYMLRVRGGNGVILSEWIPAASICGDDTCRFEGLGRLAPGRYSWRVQPGDPDPLPARSQVGRFRVE